MKITAEVSLTINVELENPEGMTTEEMEDELFELARKNIDVNTAEAMIVSYELNEEGEENEISSDS